ncbi:MAG TPA: hypothetical protein PLH98_01190 [Ruminococcus flavefaciens]|nr:hypothetical protein [Ruminococcus flavefaciens]
MPFAKEYIRYNDAMARAMAAAAEMLDDGRRRKKSDTRVRDYMMFMSRSLMRSMEVSAFAANEIPVNDREIIDMPSFCEELTNQCDIASGGRAKVVFTETDGEPFVSCLQSLRYIFLGQMRKILLNSEDRRNTFVIRSYRKDESLCFDLEAHERHDFPESGRVQPPEVMNRCPDEMCTLLAERIGAELILNENGFTLCIPPCDFRGDVSMHSEDISPEGSPFSPYSIMLADMDPGE